MKCNYMSPAPGGSSQALQEGNDGILILFHYFCLDELLKYYLKQFNFFIVQDTKILSIVKRKIPQKCDLFA